MFHYDVALLNALIDIYRPDLQNRKWVEYNSYAQFYTFRHSLSPCQFLCHYP